MQLAFIAAIATAILGVAFAMQNNVPVTVNFLIWRFDSTLAMTLLLALALGAVAIALLAAPRTLNRKWQAKRLRQRIQGLEKTCEIQQGRIAELETHMPVASSSVEPKTYVGLKQLIVGNKESSTNDAS